MKAATVEKEKKRWYPCPKCGDNHPSITTLLDVIASPALLGWMAKNGTAKLDIYHQSAAEHLSDEAVKAIDGIAEQRWLLANTTPFWKSGRQIGKEAADYGTMAHAWIEAHVSGKDISLDSLPGPARSSVEQMLKWEKLHNLKTLKTEQTFYCCKLNFAGTADWVGEIDGELTLMDWKTSTGIFFNYAIQSFGYAIADEMQHADRLYRQVGIGRFGKTGESEVRLFKRNGSPNIEDARDVITACGHIFARLQDWDRLNPWKRNGATKHETTAQDKTGV